MHQNLLAKFDKDVVVIHLISSDIEKSIVQSIDSVYLS